MAAKKSKKSMAKKSMKKTKGGILIGLNQPTMTSGIIGEEGVKSAGQMGPLGYKKL